MSITRRSFAALLSVLASTLFGRELIPLHQAKGGLRIRVSYWELVRHSHIVARMADVEELREAILEFASASGFIVSEHPGSSTAFHPLYNNFGSPIAAIEAYLYDQKDPAMRTILDGGSFESFPLMTARRRDNKWIFVFEGAHGIQ